MSTATPLHVLSIVIWIGGMVFAHVFLRLAIAQPEPPVRSRLMHDVLGCFVQAVFAASLLTLVSGVWMPGRVARQLVQSGGSFEMPLAWTVMAVLGGRDGGRFALVKESPVSFLGIVSPNLASCLASWYD